GAAQLAHRQIQIEAIVWNRVTGVLVGVLTAVLLSVVVTYELQAAGHPSGSGQLAGTQAQIRAAVDGSRIAVPLVNAIGRPIVAGDQIDANAKTYFDQIFLVLDRDRTEVHGNSEWLAELSAADVLQLLGKATLQQVLQREDFAQRLKEGAAVGAHEILYPFNQAYDSVAVQADVEIGGTDQLFNLLFGRDIQEAYGQEPQDIAVFPLLEGLDGTQKMSKSLGNYIGVSEAPEQIYGKTMSIPDRLLEKYVRLTSGMPRAEMDEVL